MLKKWQTNVHFYCVLMCFRQIVCMPHFFKQCFFLSINQMLALVHWLKGFCTRIKLQWGEKRYHWRRLEASRSQCRAFRVYSANWEWKSTVCQPNTACSWFQSLTGTQPYLLSLHLSVAASKWQQQNWISVTDIICRCSEKVSAHFHQSLRFYPSAQTILPIKTSAIWDQALLPSPQHQERIINARVETSPLVNT